MERFSELREKVLSVLLPYGVKRVALFGSVARGEDTAQSDVDILVAFRAPVGLFRLAHLQRELGECLGRPVDLVTEGFLSRYMRAHVREEQVVLYEEWLALPTPYSGCLCPDWGIPARQVVQRIPAQPLVTGWRYTPTSDNRRGRKAPIICLAAVLPFCTLVRCHRHAQHPDPRLPRSGHQRDVENPL